MKSLPRCEYCNRRGLHLVGAKSLTIERALLCGAHYKKAQVRARVAAGLAFWLNWDVNGDDVRAMMQEAIMKNIKAVNPGTGTANRGDKKC